MSEQPKKQYRKRRLFPRSLEEVVKDATKPLMHHQGKLYSALLRDWPKIVGERRAKATRPERLQFASKEATSATLHVSATPAIAPELAYECEQMLESCARYFGYRAISRIVIHANHELANTEPAHNAAPSPIQKPASPANLSLPGDIPPAMRATLERLASHVTSAKSKK